MRCEQCPVQVEGEVTLETVLEALESCDECVVERSEVPRGPEVTARLVGLLREAGKGLRKARIELRRVEKEREDLEQGLFENEERIRKLEALQRASARELEAALVERDELLRKQSNTLRALSTPILEVGDGVLALPIIGTVDDERAGRMMDELLAEVARRGASAVALDMTGMGQIDQHIAEHIVGLCRAVSLLGARVILSGLRADVVRGIVESGVDLSALSTVRSLKDALRR